MSAAGTAVLPDQKRVPAGQSWEEIGNFIVLLAYSCVVLFIVRYHEKWSDEAQAWLLARDLDLKTIWFYEARYEGHPGLWHTILWVAQRVFHAPYSALGYIGVAFAIAGAAVLVFKAPFPWFVRWPLAFTYVMVYQYAVIARPYTLLPLLCFLGAIFFQDIEHPERITIVLVLLANLSLHGTIIAGCIGLAYLIDAIRVWQTLNGRVRNRYRICAGVMVLTLVFLVFILKPTPDVRHFAPKDQRALLFQQPTRTQKLLSIVCGAFFDYPAPSFLFILLTAAWCFTRRRMAIFAFPVAFLIALYSLVQGYAHHHGTVFVATVTALWIAWPTTRERLALDLRSRRLLQGMCALLICLCAANILAAGVVIRREYLYPYSGAPDAASYLKAVGADRQVVFGYLYGIVAVEPYFDHNIFGNMPTAFFHHGTTFKGGEFDAEEVRRANPEYIVVYTTDPQLMLDTDGPLWASLGYKLVHFSDGYYLYKRVVYQRETYFIFRRIHPSDAQTPLPVSPDK